MTITVSVMYPNEDNTRFDLGYYLSKHMGIVNEEWSGQGMLSARAIKGLGTPNPKIPAPYHVIALIEFPDIGAFQAAASSDGGKRVLGDISNFTDVTPIVQISENL